MDKPRINVGTTGHVNHGRATLNAALACALIATTLRIEEFSDPMRSLEVNTLSIDIRDIHDIRMPKETPLDRKPYFRKFEKRGKW